MSEHETINGQIGTDAEHLITKMRLDEQDAALAIGNVLRRTCEFIGKDVCKQECQLQVICREGIPVEVAKRTVAIASTERSCADLNLLNAIRGTGIPAQEILMVGVTANYVGFGDRLAEYEKEGDLKQNSVGGWQELPGFNAFFARTEEVSALGRRLADCADVNFEFKDADGNTVIGFEHGTRTNMFGRSAYPFERDGKKVSFTEYTVGQAIDHYGADPASIKIKLAAAIKGHNFQKHFDSREKMEGHLPGWYEDGFVTNISNPDWKEGDEIIAEDTWEADTRSMIIRDITEAMQALGVPPENFNMDGIIDPGDSGGVHSSHEFRDKYGDTRDLYLTYAKESSPKK